MVVWNVGSINSHVTNVIGTANIPSSISGTVLDDMIQQEINYVNQIIKEDSIDSTAIIEKYQPPVIDLTLSKLLFAIDAQEGGADIVKLGELSVHQSAAGGNSAVAKSLREDAIMRLKELQRRVRFKRVIG